MAGSVLPDLPAMARATWLVTRRTPRGGLIAGIYLDARWRPVHRALHAVWGPLLLAALTRDGRGRALAGGWAGHVAVDLLTHHDDAWAPAWPLSARRWPAPLSYWQPEHHARALLAAELVASALVLRRGGPTTLTAVDLVMTASALRGALGRQSRSALTLPADADARRRALPLADRASRLRARAPR